MKAARVGGQRRSSLDASAVNALLDAAGAHYLGGRLDEAARLYLRVEAHDRRDIRARYSLATIDIRCGRFEAARVRLLDVTRRGPDHFAAWHNLGVTQQSLDRWRGAAAAFATARALRPGAAETGFSLARALAAEGRTNDALALYRVLAAEPADRGRALARLAILRPEAVTDEELDLMPARRRARSATLALRFALGAALDARGEFDAAFAEFELGAAVKLASPATGDPACRPAALEQAHEQSAALRARTFTPELFARHAGGGDAGLAPIFVVGFPRCGSSMVEQILASHPEVQGLGETSALAMVADGAFPYAAGDHAASTDFKTLAENYKTSLRSLGWKSRCRPIDKTLENYLRLGVIALMFPRSVILHCVRDPLDTGLGCFRQLFASGNETLYDPGQIGREYVRYRGVMDHWRGVLPGRVIEVSYEALVQSPEERIRWLVTEACGLDWAPQCLKFHETRRPVVTASVDEVRRPIYRSSLDRWRRYQRHLSPLVAAMGPYAPAQS